MMADMPILTIENLSISLGRFALHDVNLSLQAGDYICLIGPTGAGKTIFFECIAGPHRLREGRILLNRIDVVDMPPENRGIGYVPQDYALFPI